MNAILLQYNPIHNNNSTRNIQFHYTIHTHAMYYYRTNLNKSTVYQMQRAIQHSSRPWLSLCRFHTTLCIKHTIYQRVGLYYIYRYFWYDFETVTSRLWHDGWETSHHKRPVWCAWNTNAWSVQEIDSYITYLLTPRNRVLLEKLTSKLCS